MFIDNYDKYHIFTYSIFLEYVTSAHEATVHSLFEGNLRLIYRPSEDFLMAVRHFPMLYYIQGTINR